MTIMHLRLFSLGFGNVGRAVARLLAAKADELHARYDLTLSYVGVATRAAGFAFIPGGLSPAQVVADGFSGEQVSGPVVLPLDRLLFAIRQTPADVVLELTPLNPHSGQPAIEHIRAALESGKHVVTANKGPIAYAYQELRALAEARGVAMRFESTVLDGTPLFGMAEASLPATHIASFRGLLNSTSNYVLGRMALGDSLEEAVAGAQRLGIAEADPSNDLEGWDGAVKATVLANVLMGADLRPGDVAREAGSPTGGLLGAAAMRLAQDALLPGQTLKQVVEAQRDGTAVTAGVRLAALPPSDLFAHLSGMETAIQLHTDTMHDLTVVEGEGGPEQTAFGVLADLVAIARRPQQH
jgi:homoserine dehydrogenase